MAASDISVMYSCTSFNLYLATLLSRTVTEALSMQDQTPGLEARAAVHTRSFGESDNNFKAVVIICANSNCSSFCYI